MKKLTVIVLSALLPMSLAFAGQEPIPVNDLDYAFAGEVLVAEPLSESEMEAVEGEFVVAVSVVGIALCITAGAGLVGFLAGAYMHQ